MYPEGHSISTFIYFSPTDQPDGHSTRLPAAEAAQRGGRNPSVRRAQGGEYFSHEGDR